MIGKTVAEKILSRVSLRAQGPLARDARAGDLVIVPIRHRRRDGGDARAW